MLMQHNVRAWCFTWGMMIVIITAPMLARAHGSAPAGLTPFVVDGELVGVATNIGLVLHVDGVPTWWTSLRVEGTLRWTGYTESGRILVGASDTLLVTDDAGCTLLPHSPLFDGKDVRVMALHPDTARPHFIATGTEGETNSIYVTSDGGDTWAALEATETTGRYLGVHYSRSAEHYMTLRTSDTEGVYVVGQISVLGDLGQSVDVSIGTADDVRVITPSAAVGSVFIAAFIADPDASGVPVGMPAPGADTLYEVDVETGAATAVVTLTESNRFFSGGAFEGETYFTDYSDRLLRFTEGDLVEVGEERRYCIRDSLSDDTLWACGIRPQEHSFYTSTDGENWQGMMLFDDIAVGECPEQDQDGSGEPSDETDSSGGDNGNAGDSSAGLDESSKPVGSGGCSGTPLGPAWLLCLLLMVRRLELQLHSEL